MVKELKENKHLKKVLELILALGNYLNGGTNKGQAHGFRPNEINKLKNTKSASDSSVTLLHFLVLAVDKSIPEAAEFTKELKDVDKAARVELSFLQGEAAKLRASMRKVESEIKVPQVSTDDQFQPVMTAFFEDKDPVVQGVWERVDKLEKDAHDVIRYFGEDPSKMPMEELFGIFKLFVKDYSNALEKVNKDRALAKKKAATAAKISKDRQKDQASGKKKKQVMFGGSGDSKEMLMDSVLSDLAGSNTSQIRSKIRARRRQAGTMRRKTVKPADLGRDLASSGLLSSPSKGNMDENGDTGGEMDATVGKKKAKKKKKKVWQEHKDDEGDIYYYNTKTGESTWDRPPNFPYAS
jgi:hypothetical protein